MFLYFSTIFHNNTLLKSNYFDFKKQLSLWVHYTRTCLLSSVSDLECQFSKQSIVLGNILTEHYLCTEVVWLTNFVNVLENYDNFRNHTKITIQQSKLLNFLKFTVNYRYTNSTYLINNVNIGLFGKWFSNTIYIAFLCRFEKESVL